MSVDFIRFLIFAGILVGLVFVALAVPAFRPYLRKNPAVAFLLGISSGFPNTLVAATMTFWLAKTGFTPTTIGFAVMVGIPYTIKFLWAPLIDKIPLPILTKALGQRRSWLFFIQFFLVISIWQMGASNPQPGDYGWFLFWAVVTAFFSATQDIVIDAYRIEILEEEEFAHGTATNQFGYRTGNLIAGAGTIYFASQEGLGLGWAMAYALTTLCVVPAILGAFWAGEGKFVDRFGDAAGMKPGQWVVETVVNPFREFLTRDGALMILLFILVYKVGDAMGQAMIGPMIVDLKFADLDYITANKIWGFAALIIGSALGGPFVLWLGMGRALLVSVLLMMFSNFMFMALSIAGNNYEMLVAAIVTENITSGIGLTVVAVYLSGLANIAYTATQFALLSSVAVIGRTFMAGPAGYAAEKLGWTGFWGVTIIAAIPGMILLWMMWRKGYVVQSIRQSGEIDETKLRKPVGAARIFGFALIVAGVVGVLMANQLELASWIMVSSFAAFVVGALLAWKVPAPKAT